MKLWIAIGLLATLLAGCSTVVQEGAAPGVRVRNDRAPQAGIRLNTVQIIDDGLQQWQGSDSERWSKISVESTNSRRTATGTLEVWGVLRNRTDFPLQLEGRTTFFDQYQVPAEKPTAWRRVMLPPNGVAAYKELSVGTNDIAYYYIEIREGR
jgi:hypothetical protein